MTRRDMILEILAEASGRPLDQVGDLFTAMLEANLISHNGLDEKFTESQARQMLDEFRGELPGIRRWLMEEGLLEKSGHA
ncbi:MAG: hypothetical protein IH614_05125 [Desulfuromonadales bacterium]|nr:hypothetical protein [Desulfuromonadales bacterium]